MAVTGGNDDYADDELDFEQALGKCSLFGIKID